MLQIFATAFMGPIVGAITPFVINYLIKKSKQDKTSKNIVCELSNKTEIKGTIKNFYFSIVTGALFLLLVITIEIFFQNITLFEDVTTRMISILLITFAFMFFSISCIAFREALRYRGE